jgi:hypothetical protein
VWKLLRHLNNGAPSHAERSELRSRNAEIRAENSGDMNGGQGQVSTKIIY